MRIDADDWLTAGALSEMKKKMDEDGSGIVYSAYYGIELDNSLTEMPAKLHHHAGCALMDKRMINELRFSNHLKHWDSLDLYNRIRLKNIPVSYIHHPLWYYRIRPDSMSHSTTEERKRVLSEVTNGGLKGE